MDMNRRSTFAIVLLVLLGLLACNPFAPEKKKGGGGTPDRTLQNPTTPEILFENLDYAMNNRDIEVYEDLLDEDYWFTEPSEIDSLDLAWGKDYDMDAVRNIFEAFTTFEYNFIASRRDVELGIEYPGEGPDAHPDEDWDVFFGPVEMFMLDDNSDGFIVNQNMTFKLRQDKDTDLYTIIRWVSHPSTSASSVIE